MMNPYENCASFHLDPEKVRDRAAFEVQERNKNVVSITFKKELGAEDMSAMALSQLFSSYGDF